MHDNISPIALQSQEKFKIRLWLYQVGQILLTSTSLLLSCKVSATVFNYLGNFLELYACIPPQHKKITACPNVFTILASFCDAPLADSGLFYCKKVRDTLIWHMGAHSVQSACTIHIFSEFNLSAFYRMKMYLDWRPPVFYLGFTTSDKTHIKRNTL